MVRGLKSERRTRPVTATQSGGTRATQPNRLRLDHLWHISINLTVLVYNMTSNDKKKRPYWAQNLSELQDEFRHLHSVSFIEKTFHDNNHDADLTRRTLRGGDEISNGANNYGEGAGSGAAVSVAGGAGDFKVEEEFQDLFSLGPDWALAHCVSRDLAMGKGIAVEFKKRFRGVDELKRQQKGIGETCVLEVSTVAGKRYIFYMITKERYFHKPTYDSLQASLNCVRDSAVQSGVEKLAMPRIGCGLDGLKWERVLPMIVECFQGSGIQVRICSVPMKPAHKKGK